MTYQYPGKQMRLVLTLVLAFAATAAQAQINPADAGYLTDQRGQVVRSGSGLCWRAGSQPSPEAINECDPRPLPLARLEQPRPRAAAVPDVVPVPVGDKITLDADTLFDFNKAVLRPAGRTALDEFLYKMKDMDPEVIVVVGHADRIGTTAYNQSLSERRAASVRAYLEGKGVASNRIHTEGKGESQPMTKAGQCDGRKSAKVIACLQPDRRVELELVATRIAR